MIETLALTATFWKGIVVVACSFILFVGSIYLILSAVFGLRMGYLVLAVSFFGWMIVFSAIWAFGQPPILGVTGTLRDLGPRGTEAHWQVFAAGTAPLDTKYPGTENYPAPPWQPPTAGNRSSVDTAKTAIQDYLVEQASERLERQGVRVCPPESIASPDCYRLDPATFVVTDFAFTPAPDGTSLAAAQAFFQAGGAALIVYAYHDSGNVPIYSFAFLAASILGFVIHIPFLDRAERKRKALLTGGTAPPWYGPA
jgi:hypothetical protein